MADDDSNIIVEHKDKVKINNQEVSGFSKHNAADELSRKISLQKITENLSKKTQESPEEQEQAEKIEEYMTKGSEEPKDEQEVVLDNSGKHLLENQVDDDGVLMDVLSQDGDDDDSKIELKEQELRQYCEVLCKTVEHPTEIKQFLDQITMYGKIPIYQDIYHMYAMNIIRSCDWDMVKELGDFLSKQELNLVGYPKDTLSHALYTEWKHRTKDDNNAIDEIEIIGYLQFQKQNMENNKPKYIRPDHIGTFVTDYFYNNWESVFNGFGELEEEYITEIKELSGVHVEDFHIGTLCGIIAHGSFELAENFFREHVHDDEDSNYETNIICEVAKNLIYESNVDNIAYLLLKITDKQKIMGKFLTDQIKENIFTDLFNYVACDLRHIDAFGCLMHDKIAPYIDHATKREYIISSVEKILKSCDEVPDLAQEKYQTLFELSENDNTFKLIGELRGENKELDKILDFYDFRESLKKQKYKITFIP